MASRDRRTIRSGGLLVLCLVLQACYKELATPPELPADHGAVSVRFSLVHGLQPFRMDSSFMDSYGNRLRVTRLQFLLGRWRALDDDDVVVADLSGPLVLVDGAEPVEEHPLGRMDDGHIHTVEFSAGPAGGTVNDPELVVGGEGVHMVLQGFVDRDLDGHFTEGVDVPFDYRASGDGSVRERHIHVHADMIGGVPVVLPLQVDVRFLFIGVDPMQTPSAAGADTLAQRIMDNLVSMTWVDG